MKFIADFWRGFRDSRNDPITTKGVLKAAAIWVALSLLVLILSN